jgi:PAS domain S-box-containing protein
VPGVSDRTSDPGQATLDRSPAIVVVGPDGTIVAADGEAERQFGYPREEVVGQLFVTLLPGASTLVTTPAANLPHLRELDAGHQLSGQRKDGSRFAVAVAVNHVPTSDGLFHVASITDVAERGRREEARSAAEREQAAFETLVAELSFRFNNVAGEDLAAAIGDGLRQVCEPLGLDRGTFFRIDLEGVLFDALSWTTPGFLSEHWPLPAAQHFPWTIERILAGEVVAFATISDVQGLTDRASFTEMGNRSTLLLPLRVDGRVGGAAGFTMLSAEREWTTDLRRRLDLAAALFAQALARKQRDEMVRAATLEIQQLKGQLQGAAGPRREGRNGRSSVVGQSAAVRRVLDQIQQVAATDSTVLLLGETGTGKELFAAQIHELGSRSSHQMVKVNCAAIPATLIESELFGREKGAFTGALARQPGRFEMADHSTIFLDEIGDLPAEVQVKLLRVLEERTIERLGSPRPITVDVRIIAATHRNLEQRVAEGSFREDLYYRLNVFPIRVPPLRERVEDIPVLVWHFVEEFSRALGKRIDAIDKDVMTALQQYAWPGNVRELRNVVERAMIVSTSKRLVIPSPHTSAAATRRSPKLVDVEKEHIRSVLESTGWRIRGSGGAADRLGLKPTTLETRMAKLGLIRPGHR